MKYLTIYTLFIFLLVSTSSYSQKSFLTTDSATTYGLTGMHDFGRMNFEYCHMMTGDSLKKYTPYEIKEYGLNDGKVYTAKDIQISSTTQRVFVERLLKGKTTLYYYHNKGIKTYFIEKGNSALLELSKSKGSFKNTLIDLTSECPDIKPAAEITGFRKRSLANFFGLYNECSLRTLPYIKYGISISYGMIKMVKPPLKEDMLIPTPIWRVRLDQLEYKYSSSYTLGLFLDNPILKNNYSLHTELNYTYYKSTYNQNMNSTEVELAFNYSTLSIPMMVRYTLPHKKIQPFINAGPHFSAHLNNSSSYEINGSLVTKYPLMTNKYLGYSIGGGIEYKRKYSKSLFFEMRYTRLYGLTKSETYRISGLQLLTGINF